MRPDNKRKVKCCDLEETRKDCGLISFIIRSYLKLCMCNYVLSGENNSNTQKILARIAIGHFRVAVNLIMKARLSAKLFM